MCSFVRCFPCLCIINRYGTGCINLANYQLLTTIFYLSIDWWCELRRNSLIGWAWAQLRLNQSSSLVSSMHIESIPNSFITAGKIDAIGSVGGVMAISKYRFHCCTRVSKLECKTYIIFLSGRRANQVHQVPHSFVRGKFLLIDVCTAPFALILPAVINRWALTQCEYLKWRSLFGWKFTLPVETQDSF